MPGRADCGAIVCWLPTAPMLKSIVFTWPVAALESRSPCRSEPAPLSLVLVAEKVDGSHRISRSWKLGRYDLRFGFARFATAFRRPASLSCQLGGVRWRPALQVSTSRGSLQRLGERITARSFQEGGRLASADQPDVRL